MIPYRELALASKESYSTHTHIVGTAEACITTFDDKNYICAFAGTQKDFKDILTDLRGFPWYDRELKAWCHSGFLKTTRPLFINMLGDIRAILVGGNTLHFTGHSLGGARATITVAKLRRIWAANAISLTTFGAPPAQYGHGLDKWLETVPKKIFKHGADFVPSHPMFGSHVDELVQVGGEDTLARSVSEARWLDHRINNYCISV